MKGTDQEDVLFAQLQQDLQHGWELFQVLVARYRQSVLKKVEQLCEDKSEKTEQFALEVLGYARNRLMQGSLPQEAMGPWLEKVADEWFQKRQTLKAQGVHGNTIKSEFKPLVFADPCLAGNSVASSDFLDLSDQDIARKFQQTAKHIESTFWKVIEQPSARKDGSMARNRILLVEAARSRLRSSVLKRHFEAEEIAHKTITKALGGLHKYKDLTAEGFIKWLDTLQENHIIDLERLYGRRGVSSLEEDKLNRLKDSGRGPEELEKQERLKENILDLFECLIEYSLASPDGVVRLYIFLATRYLEFTPRLVKSHLDDKGQTFEDLTEALQMYFRDEKFELFRENEKALSALMAPLYEYLQSPDPEDPGKKLGQRETKAFLAQKDIDSLIQNIKKDERDSKRIQACCKKRWLDRKAA